MTEPNLRLQRARREAGFETATDAARTFGWNENTYRSHENGERGLTTRSLIKYGFAFRVSYSWLLTGEGHHKLNNHLPVRGRVKNKGIVNFLNNPIHEVLSQVVGEVIVQFAPPPNSWCYRIESDNLGSRYNYGDILICWSNINYDPALKQDGIILTNSGQGGLQIAIADAFTMINIQHRFTKEELGVQPRFEPVQIVVRDGMYLSDETFADRMIAENEKKGAS